MNALRADVRSLILRRLQEAPLVDVIDVAAKLQVDSDTPPPANGARFLKIGACGQVLSDHAPHWVAVQEAQRLPDGSRRIWCSLEFDECKFGGAQAVIDRLNKEKHAGFDDWRLATRKELFGLTEDDKCSPAIDTRYFPGCKSDWYWASTPVAASSPGACAWVVSFGFGYADWVGQSYDGFVRAVRVGQ